MAGGSNTPRRTPRPTTIEFLMPAPFASVIIPCYKMGRYIGQALESVGNQLCVDWEIIIVDDCGPADGTREAVAAFSARFPQHRVEFIRHEVNQGVSAARNTAIAAAKGTWLAFLDPDDYWLDQHLSNAARLLTTRPEAGVVSSPVEILTETEHGVELALWQVPPDWKEGLFPASLVYYNFIQPSATLVRKELLDRVGGFDTSPALQHIEDYDLWLRLIQIGSQFAFLPTASCRYRRHAGGATNNPKLMLQLHQELAKKHAPYFIHMQSRLLHTHAYLLSEVKPGPILLRLLILDRFLSRSIKYLRNTAARYFRHQGKT